MSRAGTSPSTQDGATHGVGSGDLLGVQCPNCNRWTTGGLFGHMNDPNDWQEAKWIVTHCGCYHEPKGGERYTAERDARDFTINGDPSLETANAIREMVRLVPSPNT